MKYPQYFICATKEYATHEKAVPAPLFRAVFHIDSYEKVQLVICGLGLYRVFCNGNEITRGRLASCPSNPDQLLYYETYDITKLVQQGKNVIGILLGNGMLNCNGGDHCCACYRRRSFLSVLYRQVRRWIEAQTYEPRTCRT